MNEIYKLPDSLNQKLKELREINMGIAFPKENFSSKAKQFISSILGKDFLNDAILDRDNFIDFVNKAVDKDISDIQFSTLYKSEFVKCYMDELNKNKYTTPSKMKIFDDTAFGDNASSLYNFGDIYNIDAEHIKSIFELNKLARVSVEKGFDISSSFDIPEDFDDPELIHNKKYYNSFTLYLNALKEIDDCLFSYRQFVKLFENEQDSLQTSNKTIKTPYMEYVGEVTAVNKNEFFKDYNEILEKIDKQYERKNFYFIKYVDYINSGLFTLSINFINKRTPDENGNIKVTSDEIKLMQRVSDTYKLHRNTLRTIERFDNDSLINKFTKMQYDNYLLYTSNLISNRSKDNIERLKNFVCAQEMVNDISSSYDKLLKAIQESNGDDPILEK